MKRFSTTAFVITAMFFLSAQALFGQLTGSKTIPGDYATISAAVTDLNTQGVGAGGVTFNVAAGYTESTTAQITITATGTSGNPIVFQKSGAGANPLITRTDAGTNATSALGGLGDGIVQLAGTDYITFDGIDLTASNSGIEYGYYFHKPSGTDGCQYVTIKNSTITMTKGTSGYVAGIYVGNGASSVSSATGVTVSAATGVNRNVTLTGNTITNVHAGIVCRGSSAIYDTTIAIGQSGAGNTIRNFGGGSATTTYGVYFIYVTHPSVSYNTIDNAGGGGTAHGSTLYGIFYSTVLGNVVGSNNAITMSESSTSGVQWIYNSNGVTSETFNNNTFSCGSFASTTTSYLVYSSNSTNVKSISGNQTSGTFNKTGAGTFYGYYNNGSPTGGTETVQNNTFAGITLTGASSFYAISTTTGASQSKVISGNVIRGITGGTSSIYGINSTYGATSNIYSNVVSNLSAAAGIYGLSIGNSSSVTTNLYSNTVDSLVSTGASALYGIYIGGSTTLSAYGNNVFYISGNNASTLTYGIYVSAGTTVYLYNNFVSDLRATAATGTNAIGGIYVSGGTTVGAYYNSIYLNATSSSATTFGTSGIYTSTTPTLDLRNNAVVNLSAPGPTGGFTVAYRRSSTTLTTYSSSSNNNDFFVNPAAGVQRYYYNDGTNADSAFSAYKGRVSPRDASSFAENAPFLNVSTPPFNLHVNPGVATQLESGGTPVTSPIAITTDYDGDTRNATTPDVGADEFAGTPLDLSPPTISYAALLNTSSTSSRTLSATISDPSGVPTAGVGRPVLYWKIRVAGTWTSATGTFVSGTQYSFTFGSGVVTGDTVYYYVVAQDNSPAVNVGAYPSAGAGGFTSNPPAAATPPTLPSAYYIVSIPLAGDYTVGLTLFNRVTGKHISFEKVSSKVMVEVPEMVPVQAVQDEGKLSRGNAAAHTAAESTSPVAGYQPTGRTVLKEVERISYVPMENGKPYDGPLYVKRIENPTLSPDALAGVYATITAAVSDLNLRGVSAATRLLLNDATYASETYPITVNVTNVSVPTATNTVTIKPNTGVTATVGGVAASTQIFKILSSYVSIDGSNAVSGTSRNLTLNNTSATSPQVVVIGSTGTTPITNVTLKNCIVINGVNTSSAVIVSDGASPGTAGYFNNTTIQNNSLQLAYIAIYCNAVATAGNGSGLTVAGNDLNTSGTNAIGIVGVYVQGADGATVTNNNVANFATTLSAYRYGIWLATGTVNSTVAGNNVGPLTSTVSTYYPTGIAVTSGAASSNDLISGNTLHDLSHTSSGDAVSGIIVSGATGGVKLTKNAIYNISNVYSGGYGAWGIALSSSLTASNIEVSNNLIYNVTAYGYASLLYENGIGIFCNTGGGYNIYHNSVNLFTNQTAGQSASVLLTSSIATASSINIRNNIFANQETVMANYCVYSAATNAVFADINYNDYYAASATNGYIGYLGAAKSTLADWQTATTHDANSLATNPLFVSTSDLRLVTGSPVYHAGTAIAAVTTDITGAVRDGSTPTIGAYENTVNSGPVITYTALSNTYITGNVTLSNVTISSTYGVAGGAVAPRVYWKVNGGAWSSAATGSSGSPYSFTIGTTGLSVGDSVSYFVIAQDGLGVVNANPGTGLVATDVNTVTTPPTTPNGYKIVVNSNYGGGGAGTGGYYFANSTPGAAGAPSQPTYNWIDPVAAGHTKITMSGWTYGNGDDGYFRVPSLPFHTTFFGVSVDSIYISSNGFIRINGIPYKGAYGPTTFPNVTDTNRACIAVAWCDIDTRDSIYPAVGTYYGGDASKFVVTYFAHKYASTTDSIACQIILFPSGNVILQYNDSKSTYPASAITTGADVGIEDGSGTQGIGYRVQGSGGPMFGSPLAVAFGTDAGALPIQLSSFTAHINQGGGVRLDWRTTSETNNYGFFVQRRLSGDQDWTTVSSLIPGHGTTLEPHSYGYVDNTVSAPGTYQYRLRQMDLDGTAHHVDPISIVLGTTDVKDLAPKVFALFQNYPNPFNPETTIKFSVEKTDRATLEVYNILGQRVATLFNGVAEAGQYYKVRLAGLNLASGMYIYRLQSGRRTDIKKMLLLK